MEKSEIRDRVAEALDMVQMRSFAARMPAQLSGGQQQRIALARALVNRPAVLLLDEPLGALDRKLREEMQLELKLLQSQLGTTFIFVTHDQGEALSMSDRIAIMRNGRIEQLADPDTIYSDPASAYVAEFIGQHNFFDGSIDGDRLETGWVRFQGERLGLERPGGRVRLGIRPEFIRLRPAEESELSAPALANAVVGTVETVAHQGESLLYHITVGDGATISARRPTAERLGLAPGDRVVAEWAGSDLRTFSLEDVGDVRRELDEDVSTREISNIRMEDVR